MQVLNCLIVEDEPLAAGIIRDYIAQVPGLREMGLCDDVFSANELLRKEKIDLIFLDINLPGVNGIDFLKILNGKYQVILTTAYHEYAIDGFNLNVADYLLKPIEFSRFLQAVNKVYTKLLPEQSITALPDQPEKFYFFNTDKKKIKVHAADILYIESLKDYVRIHTRDKNIVTKFQIGEIDQFLNEKRFIRIHKSYMINVERVTAYNASEVELGDVILPLGRTYKELVERRLRE
jgi:DNA-binding LytR/AlgR family response regulator